MMVLLRKNEMAPQGFALDGCKRGSCQAFPFGFWQGTLRIVVPLSSCFRTSVTTILLQQGLGWFVETSYISVALLGRCSRERSRRAEES